MDQEKKSIMSLLQSTVTARFTANARNISALIATCLAAYGLSMLSWLETKQQRDIQLNPRQEAPDFLVTQARYLEFKPIDQQETLTPSATPSQGLVRLDIQSKSLSHFDATNTTLFEKPIIEFSDNDNQTWHITAATATTSISAEQHDHQAFQQPTEKIHLENDVQITALSQTEFTMHAKAITINTTDQSITATSHLSMDFQNGHLTAGGLTTQIQNGKITLNQGVKAIYYPKGSP